ncbi:MAG: purine-nucleoside phosphorylase [Ruminococcaceae bacterium]|nr:purine-nucleoside phosphorylase [Oscillospiraceae bacterium]
MEIIMNPIEKKLFDCYECIRKKTDFSPRVAMILGSGLGSFADSLRVECAIDYAEIKGFPRSTVSGHKGRFVFGYLGNVPVVIMQGRVHYYEGYEMSDVVLPVRIMRLMGAEILVLTNAAGGINTGFSIGEFMIIRDQISSFVPSPLIGANIDSLGTRFPDMTRVYDRELSNKIADIAASEGIKIQNGVYLQTTGPQYETPAEIRAYRELGADAVGMSTACEAIAARHCGFRICGISCITNLAAGMSGDPLSHEEVKETTDRVGRDFSNLLGKFVATL